MASSRPSTRVLLLGGSGQVGHELRGTLPSLGELTIVPRSEADLSKPESLRAVLRAYQPRVVVNAAAYTAVDRAEGEPELAHSVNAVAPGVLAEEAEALGALMVHYSTDYVFDGRKPEPYDESDTPNPLSVYGRSKLEGERRVASACRRHLILRTSWVLGAHGENFLKTILRLAAEREALRVVSDQRGAPTSAALIAEATAALIHEMRGARAADARWGIYHLASAGDTTWYEYASYAIGRARRLGWPLRTGPEAIVAIRSDEYPTPAVRPANSRLDTSRLRREFGVSLPEWTSGIDQTLQQLTDRKVSQA
jgi:dTDP-4-dehydrorhamnose reductase